MKFPITPALQVLIDCIVNAGGEPIIVGGAVRDHLLGISPKDVDLEIFKLPLVDLEACLQKLVMLAPHQISVDAVGRTFGVLKVTIGAETFDVALPRRENKAGTGHKGFVVDSDPSMSFSDAAARRDFTINAIGYDPQQFAGTDEFGEWDEKFLDPHGGIADMEAKIIRHVSNHFDEDPLRVLRGCQFAARFGFTIAPETIVRCQTLTAELTTLPKERLWEEWKKLFVKSAEPSAGLNAMVDTGAIDLFPEVKALLFVKQNPQYHPEGQDHPRGSLWVHNCMVTDSAVRVLVDDNVTDEEERLIVILAAFCHDLGKPAVTEFRDGRWRALGHEEAGEAPTRSFLERIGAPPAIIEAVVPVVLNHLKPFIYGHDKASPTSIRRLALAVPLVRLCRVARADFLGRTTPDALVMKNSQDVPETAWLLAQAEQLKVLDGKPKPFLFGRHLLTLGMKPGKAMGDLIKATFEAQLEGQIEDEESAIAWAAERIK